MISRKTAATMPRRSAFWRVLTAVVVGATLASLSCTATGQPGARQSNDARTTPLPESLDEFFPPKAAQPVYLLEMLELGGRFSQIAADAAEGDWQNTTADFDAFKSQYNKLAALVPEWKGRFPAGPVNDLGTALEHRARDRVMSAHDKVADVCRKCHTTTMSRVQFKYHWGDFSAISIRDPITGEKMTFSALMAALNQGLAGITAALAQGQHQEMHAHFKEFNQRFQTLKETCTVCHTSKRKYYITGSEQTVVDELGAALRASSADSAKVRQLIQRIGMDSCFRCHLVHVPAAYSKNE